MCEILCVKKNNSAFSRLGAIFIFFVIRRTGWHGGGGFPLIVTLWRAQGCVLNDSQKTESFTLASAIQPGALVGEFFLCVFIEVCTERAQKL